MVHEHDDDRRINVPLMRHGRMGEGWLHLADYPSTPVDRYRLSATLLPVRPEAGASKPRGWS